MVYISGVCLWESCIKVPIFINNKVVIRNEIMNSVFSIVHSNV